MSRIVKSVAVVDDRPAQTRVYPKGQDVVLGELTVIKPQFLSVDTPPPSPRLLRSKQSYLDELNRVQVEVDQAKAELRSMRRELEETREELASLPPIPQQSDEELPENTIDATEAAAAAMLAQAKREAEALLDQATVEADELIRQAKEEGYRDGYQQGYEDARDGFITENQPFAEDVEELVRRMSSFEKDRLSHSETDLVRLCVSICEKIVGRELQTGPEAIRDMLWQAVEHNRREEYIKITIAPDLLSVEMQADEKARAILQELGANVTVQVDKEAQPGTCVLETPVGLTDLSVETQLNNVEAALIG